MPPEPRPITGPDGVRYVACVEPRDGEPISVALANGECPFADHWDLLSRFAPVGGRVLDLGAHLGGFALMAAAAGRQVLAVDAAPANVASLRASREANAFPHLTVVHAAVAEHEGQVSFLADGPWGRVTDGGPGTVVVPAVPPHAILARHGWSRVDLVKLDVEGSEMPALRGMAGILGRPDAPALFFESNGPLLADIGSSPTELKSAVERLGYKLFLADVEARVLHPVTADCPQPEYVADYLAVKPRHDSPRSRMARWLTGRRALRGYPVRERTTAELADAFRRWLGCDGLSWAAAAHMPRELALAPQEVRADASITGLLARVQPASRAA